MSSERSAQEPFFSPLPKDLKFFESHPSSDPPSYAFCNSSSPLTTPTSAIVFSPSQAPMQLSPLELHHCTTSLLPTNTPISRSSLTPPPILMDHDSSNCVLQPASLAKDALEFTIPQHLLDLTLESVMNLSNDESRAMLFEASQILRRSNSCVQNYKGLISRMKFQSQLLTIEAHEAVQRSEVEKKLIQREVDRLRYEQIEIQNTMAAKASIMETSDAYKRQLRKTKSELKDAVKDIENRDKDIARFKWLLNEGGIGVNDLENAPTKQTKEPLRAPSQSTTSPPLGSFFHSSSIDTTPVTPQQKNQDSRSDALGISTLNSFCNGPQQALMSPKNRIVPPVSADFPQFPLNNLTPVNLPPLRLVSNFNKESALTSTRPLSKFTLLSPPAIKETSSQSSNSIIGTLREPGPWIGSSFLSLPHEKQHGDLSVSTRCEEKSFKNASPSEANPVGINPKEDISTPRNSPLDVITTYDPTRENSEIPVTHLQSSKSPKPSISQKSQTLSKPSKPFRKLMPKRISVGNVSKPQVYRPNNFSQISSNVGTRLAEVLKLRQRPKSPSH